jgi:predicted transglutaminase-like cysteine proteinase
MHRTALLLLFAALLLTACETTDATQATRMPLGQPVATPLGAHWFCYFHTLACTRELNPVPEMAMTDQRWAELRAVQDDVNRDIRPSAFLSVSDIGWHYPRHHIGDCVQYALLKRHKLLMQGWPSGTLHLTTVVTAHEQGHLVLVVSTNQGDWVLDNLHDTVLPWDALPYRWVARQQGPTFKDWVSVAASH